MMKLSFGITWILTEEKVLETRQIYLESFFFLDQKQKNKSPPLQQCANIKRAFPGFYECKIVDSQLKCNFSTNVWCSHIAGTLKHVLSQPAGSPCSDLPQGGILQFKIAQQTKHQDIFLGLRRVIICEKTVLQHRIFYLYQHFNYLSLNQQKKAFHISVKSFPIHPIANGKHLRVI